MNLCARLAAATLCVTLMSCDRPVETMVDEAANTGGDNNVNAANAIEPVRSILREETASPATPVVEPVRIIISFGSSGLRADDAGRDAIDTLIETPAMKAGGQVTVRGHSDSRGSDGDNLVASRIRAEAVRDYLIEKGVAKDRIALIALGEDRPVAPNAREDGSDDPVGRAKNRRVEIDVALPPDIAPPTVRPTLTDEEKK